MTDHHRNDRLLNNEQCIDKVIETFPFLTREQAQILLAVGRVSGELPTITLIRNPTSKHPELN